MPEVAGVKAYSLELPLKDVFTTAKGSRSRSASVIVELDLTDGTRGLGSATPAQYVTGEDESSVLSAVNMCAPHLTGLDAGAYLPAFGLLSEMLSHAPSARAALEIAFLDAFCKMYSLPMCRFFGAAQSSAETDVTIPIVDNETAGELARIAAGQGFRHLKVKVGVQDVGEDTRRVLTVSEAAPACGIRVDANQAFTPVGAVGFAQKLQEGGVNLEMLEQPVDSSDIDGLRYVTHNTSIPVFADESAVTAEDALKLIELEAVDGINVKLMKCGVSGALDIIATCKTAREDLMLGCMIESGIGLAAAVHLACGTGAFTYIDLDAHLLLDEDETPFVGGFTSDGPVLSADPNVAGHGSQPLERGQS